MLKELLSRMRKRFMPISVFIICAYALYLRILLLYGHELWVDELWVLDEMKGSFLQLLSGLQRYEFCSYLSGDLYLVYPFFKVFGQNKWGLAIPHMIATIMGFYVLYLICKRYFKTIWAYLITFGVVCLNATLIKHATEIRAYAVLPTLALLVFYLLQKISDRGFRLKTGENIAAVVFLTLAIWFHVYGIYMFACCLIFTLLSEYGRKDFIPYLKRAALFAAVIMSIAMPLWLYSVFGPHFGYDKMTFDTFEYIPNPAHNIMGFLKSVFCNLIGFKIFYFFILGAAIPFVFSYKERARHLLFLAIIILLPVGLIFVSDVLQGYWFLQRQFIWVMPYFAFFLGWCWDTVFIHAQERRRKG